MRLRGNIRLVKREVPCWRCCTLLRPSLPCRYLTEGNDRKIRENESQIDDLKREMTVATEARSGIEKALQTILNDLAKAESLRSNITQNLRYRKGEKEIAKVQEEIDGIDIESAARSRKDFNTRYSKNLQEETNKQNAVSSHIRIILVWMSAHSV